MRRLIPLATLLLVFPSVTSAEWSDGSGWSVVETPHFTIWTNADPGRGAEIAESLELFRAVFARLAPELELKSPAPTKILAFRDAAAYAPYKSRADARDARILGQFLSHPDGNYLTLDADTERLVGSFAVIYHEYVHYFLRHNFPRVPLWFNEGLAEYYSTFAVEDGVVHVGRPAERHVRWLRKDGEIALDEVLEVTRKSASYREGEKAGRFYAVSWALVHYLFSGDAERLDQMADFFLLLRDGEDADKAFEEAFDIRLGRMEELLRAYVTAGEFPQASLRVEDLGAGRSRLSAAAPSDVLFHLGDLLAHMKRPAEARWHFRRAFDFAPDHPEAHAGMGYVLDLEKRFEEAEFFYQDAIERGSTAPLTYLLYGRHLLERLASGGEPELATTAREAFAAVTELDPGFGEGWALLGAAHLLDEGVDPGPGVAALEKALNFLPERGDIAMNLVRLHLRRASFEAAHRVVETSLAGRVDEQKLAAAREEIEQARLLHGAHEAFAQGDSERGMELYDQAIAATSDPAVREVMEGRLKRLQERFQ